MLPEWMILRSEIEAKKADLAGEALHDAKLNQAKLSEANLEGADLSKAYLIKADLRGANLVDCDFQGAVLAEADLTGANVENADFDEAYLHSANLSQVVNLTCDQLELAFLDKETRLPDYIKITWINEQLFDCESC